MSAESVRDWIERHAPDLEFIEVEDSTATVAAAAQALKVEPAQSPRAWRCAPAN